MDQDKRANDERWISYLWLVGAQPLPSTQGRGLEGRNREEQKGSYPNQSSRRPCGDSTGKLQPLCVAAACEQACEELRERHGASNARLSEGYFRGSGRSGFPGEGSCGSSQNPASIAGER